MLNCNIGPCACRAVPDRVLDVVVEDGAGLLQKRQGGSGERINDIDGMRKGASVSRMRLRARYLQLLLAPCQRRDWLIFPYCVGHPRQLLATTAYEATSKHPRAHHQCQIGACP